MQVVDSNIILRLLVRDVQTQEAEARKWLLRQPAGSVTVLDAVLVEVLFQLEAKSGYAVSRSKFLPELTHLLSASVWNLGRLTRQALKLFAETKLDYVDCILLAMKRSGSVDEIYSFDKKLIKELSV